MVAVESASNVPVLFIDPNKFDYGSIAEDGNPPSQEDIDTMRSMFEEYRPGSTENFTDSDIANFVELSLRAGPFALSSLKLNNRSVCIVNQPHETLDSGEELASFLSKFDAETLGRIPGADHYWERFLGIHEGAHCSIGSLGVSDVNTLRGEVIADRVALEWLKEHGQHELAQAIKDYRALAASKDHTHATSIFIDKEGNFEVTEDHIEAAKQMTDVMLEGVANKLGITEDAAAALVESDPEKFVQTVRENLEGGLYDSGYLLENSEYADDNSHIKEYIEDYIDAFQRQVVDPDPIQRKVRHGPSHHHRLASTGDEFEEDVDYIAVATALERIRTGEDLDPVEVEDLKLILNNPDMDPAIMDMLKEHYGEELKIFVDPRSEIDPATRPPAPTPPEQLVMN